MLTASDGGDDTASLLLSQERVRKIQSAMHRP